VWICWSYESWAHFIKVCTWRIKIYYYGLNYFF
jgi:hypothetical protein